MGEGLSGYVNGVLRTAARKEDWIKPEGHVALSLPQPLYTYLCNQYGVDETEKMGRFFLAPPRLWGRVNTSRASAETVMNRLQAEGFTAQASPCLPGALKLERTEKALPLESLSVIREGQLQLQDISAQLAVAAADPKPGDKVLDLCAAPGGKSLQAADLMGDKGSVLACDISEAKCRLIRENVQRSAFCSVETQAADARQFDPAKEGAFDLVIADLPCSGLGVAARKAEIKYRVDLAQIRELAALQRQMLEQAVRYVKPGGKLLYATCTITGEENEENADYIEQQLGLAPCSLALPWENMGLKPGDHRLQILPGQLEGDGFFISLFTREE